MLSCLSRGLVIGDGEVVNLGGVVFRACQLIPLAGLHIIAHSHIHDARLEVPAYGLAAIHGVGNGIGTVSHDAEIGAFLVLYGVVKLHGYVSSVGPQMDYFLIGQALGGSCTHLLVGGAFAGLGKCVDKLARSRM